jgi:transcriptional regulator with XRE-family HTH domain
VYAKSGTNTAYDMEFIGYGHIDAGAIESIWVINLKNNNNRLDFLKPYGLALKQYRKKAGLTQAKLAEVVNVSIKAVSNTENARAATSLDNFLKMAYAVEMSIDEVLYLGHELKADAQRHMLNDEINDYDAEEIKRLREIAKLIFRPGRNV